MMYRQARRALAAAIAATAVPAAMLATTAAATANTQPRVSASPHAAGSARISAREGRDFVALYARYRHIPMADIAQVPRDAQVAGATTGGQWAMVSFLPSPRAPLAVKVGFQDGNRYGLFYRSPQGGWKMTGFGGEPLGCGTRLPTSVRRYWHLVSCASVNVTSPRPRGLRMAPAIADVTSIGQIVDVAVGNVGVTDNPADTLCNPFTAMETSVSSSGCGQNPTYGIKDAPELWCADLAKYIWRAAGITSDIGTLNAGSSSFVAWGYGLGETIAFGGTPAPGDAVVFFPSGTTLSSVETSNLDKIAYADHVGIDVGTTDGKPDLVNGDFGLSSGTDSVERQNDIDLSSWSASIWGAGEEWVVISPDPGLQGSAPGVGVNPSDDYQYVFWRGNNADTYEAYWTGSWNGPQDMYANYGFGSDAASASAVAVSNDNNAYVYWTGTTGDIYEANYTASTGKWGHLDLSSAQGLGTATSAPGVGVNPTDDYQYVFWRGANGDLYEAYWSGSWHGPQDMYANYGFGSDIASAPAVAVSDDNNAYVFWRGTNGDIYEANYTASTGKWGHLDLSTAQGLGTATSAPGVGVNPSTDHQYLFWRGANGDLYEAYWTGSWNGPQDMYANYSFGTNIASAPAVAVSGDNNAYVFWRGTNSDIYEANYTASTGNWGHLDMTTSKGWTQ
jgi:hypothetical protein